MSFRIGLLFVAMALSACVVSSTLIFTEADIEDSINLIANSGFAPYSMMGDKALPGWNIHQDPSTKDAANISLDPLISLKGDSSLKISASNRQITIVSEPFNVRRYGGYYARIMALTDSPEAPQVTLQMVTFREDGKITNRFRQKRKLSGEWDRMTVSAGFLRPGVSWARISVIIPPFKEGSIWVDDAGCWEVHGFKID